MLFIKAITSWYRTNKRDLPWRMNKNPYSIWLSEIILQQTRIDQGLSYYEKFIHQYPTVNDLANANEDEILNMWQGLGYYSRARNLHFSAKLISSDLNGVFPTTYKNLLQLKGVGTYTAAAIASIAYNECVPVVDGNVYRVLSRYFNIATPINSTEGIKQFKLLAEELIVGNKNPGEYNQALMEYGAMICKPVNPDCTNCKLQKTCEAYNINRIKELPVKLKKIKKKIRYFDYIIINDKYDNYLIKKRNEKDIWQNLHDFNLIESSNKIDLIDILEDSLIKNNQLTYYKSITNIKQQLTHQTIHFSFHFFTSSSKEVIGDKTHFFINKNELINYAFPKTVNEIISKEIL